MTLHFKKVKIVLAKGAIDKEREVVIETWNNIYIFFFYLFIIKIFIHLLSKSNPVMLLCTKLPHFLMKWD